MSIDFISVLIAVYKFRETAHIGGNLMHSLNPTCRSILVDGYDKVRIEVSERNDHHATYIDADTEPTQTDETVGKIDVLRLAPDWEPDEDPTNEASITLLVPRGNNEMLIMVRNFKTLTKEADVAADVRPITNYGTSFTATAEDDELIQAKLLQERRLREASAYLDCD